MPEIIFHQLLTQDCIIYWCVGLCSWGISMPRKSPREWYDRRTHPILGGGHFMVPKLGEKEAYAIYWALLRLDDLIGGIPFTIRTDHRNLLFMNQQGSCKVLQWKLDIQHYNAIIEHVPGKANIPADIFSRQIIKAPTLPLFHILTLHCSTE